MCCTKCIAPRAFFGLVPLVPARPHSAQRTAAVSGSSVSRLRLPSPGTGPQRYQHVVSGQEFSGTSDIGHRTCSFLCHCRHIYNWLSTALSATLAAAFSKKGSRAWCRCRRRGFGLGPWNEMAFGDDDGDGDGMPCASCLPHRPAHGPPGPLGGLSPVSPRVTGTSSL
jgi:hypothetical protein